MTLLPNPPDTAAYWKETHPQPFATWQAAIQIIADRHLNGATGWQRAGLGRNVVFLNDTYVLKLGPPIWPGEMASEAAALLQTAGRLPVQTPELVTTGSLEGWDYLIQRRLTGRNLHEIWPTLTPSQRLALAVPHGEILAALHALPVDESISSGPLNFDWDFMINGQSRDCPASMLSAGVDSALVEQIAPYVQRAMPLLSDQRGYVPLHGDLTHLNFMVEPSGENWRITGLIDWGDAKIGPPGHEFISPAAHMYRGDHAALEAFYRGCGKRPNPLEVTARSILYYAGEYFAHLLKVIPGLDTCQTWECVESVMW